MTVAVALIDDHPIVLDGLRAALARHPEITVAWQSATLRASRHLLSVSPVDAVLLDLRLPDGSGTELLAESHSLDDPPAFVVLSSFSTPHYVGAAMSLGASGFVLKTAPIEEIVATLLVVSDGRMAFTPDQVRAARRAPWAPLTTREHQIIAGVMAGWTNDELSWRLNLARKTVEAYLSRLFIRYGVVTRTELGILAEREQMLSLPVNRRRAGMPLPGAGVRGDVERVSPASRR
jgi:DNA-binding NarL/FixJ family response regulator